MASTELRTSDVPGRVGNRAADKRAAFLLEISADAFAVGEPTGAAELELSLQGGMGTE
jgi:hypothetical protein